MAKAVERRVLNSTKRMGRPKVRTDSEQQDIILSKAIDLFLDVGFAATTMDAVAAACKISKRTLYRLFPGKLALFKSMVEAHWHSMLAFPETLAAMPLEEALLMVFRVDLDSEADQARTTFFLHALKEARHTPAVGEILHMEGGEKAKLLLANWLAERKRDGALNIGDPYSAASILMDMVFGTIILRPVDVSSLPGGADRQAYLRECIRYFVNGVK